MPRQPRYNVVGIPQHVIQRGNNRQPVFFAAGDGEMYLKHLREAADRHACDVHAYVLMTNHVHLLITPHKPDGIAKTMQSLGRKYVYYINHCYGRTGTLWEGRYKASLIDSERYLLTCYRYIEMNPVRAEMVKKPGLYKWSSCRKHAYGEANELITDHAEYRKLGKDAESRQAAYRELFDADIRQSTIDEIREALNQCRLLGRDRFKDEIELLLNRRVRPGKSGRPRKSDNNARA